MRYFRPEWSREQIKSQFTKLALENHPDRHPGEFDRYNVIMREILEDYQRAMKRVVVAGEPHPLRPDTSKARWIRTAEAAQMIRDALKRNFPGVRFYVQSSVYTGGSSIHVKWMDGPNERQVRELIGAYQGSGFDGMTDSSYYFYTWLLPDGTAIYAGTRGGGMMEEFWTPKPSEDAELVRFSCDWVNTERGVSPEIVERIAQEVQAQHPGNPVPPIRTYPMWLTKKTRPLTAYFEGDRYEPVYGFYADALKEWTAVPFDPTAPETERALPDGDAPAAASDDGASVAESVEVKQDRDWTWVFFPGREFWQGLPEDRREAFKDLGFRWSKKRAGWYAREIVSETAVWGVLGQ